VNLSDDDLDIDEVLLLIAIGKLWLVTRINMYLVSLYFDDKTNKVIQRYIDNIAKRTGNHFMLDHNVPPHMTISAIEAKNVDVLIAPFERLNKKLTAGDIRFVSTGQFMPYVFYITPVLNEYLQNTMSTVFNEFLGITDISISRFYQPFSWLPHMTLAKTLTGDQMLTALNIMQSDFSPFVARGVRVGLSRVNPHEDVRSIILQ